MMGLFASPPTRFEVGLPTHDRPFGITLWPIFELVFEMVMGYKPQDFSFVPGQTPLSTNKPVAALLISYYVIIFGGREFMRNRPALQLNTLFKAHNLGLTLISGCLLALFLEQLIPEVTRNGIFHAICSRAGGETRKLVVLYYLNYLTKYLELIDTCFLFLKKKPLTFLHTYHHGATALLCYSQLLGHTAVAWVVITLNLAVHVVMYWYYFQAARGIKIWWKQYITVMQIVQFIIDLGFVYFASWTYFTHNYFPWLPNKGNCAGEEFAAISGIVILSSYLLLFLGFYAATYKKPMKKTGRSRATSALVEMKDEKVPTVAEATRKISGGQSAMTSARETFKEGLRASPSGSPNGRVTRSRKT